MKLFNVIIIICLLPQLIFAKTVREIVIDEKKDPVSFANVMLLSDSTFVDGCVTDNNGEFKFIDATSVANIIQISIFGYNDKYVYIPQDGNCDTISLNPSATLLKELVVKGNLPFSTLKEGAFITRVDNTILAKMGSANDVLKHIPMVSGGDGYYSILGRGNATIYINGKIVRNPDEIGQLSSEDIKEVQVISTPGAQYDSNIKAVIRIVTKKNTNHGICLSTYSDNRYNTCYASKDQIDLKYRTNGLELFSTVFFERGENYGYDYQRAISIRKESALEMITQTNSKKDYTKVQGKVGANYQFNAKHSLGGYYKQEYLSAYSSGQLENKVIWDQTINNSMTELLSYTKPMPINSANIYYHGEMGKFTVDVNGDWMLVGNREESYLEEHSELTDKRNVTTFNTARNRLLAENITVSYRLFKGNVSIGEEYTNTQSKNDFRNPENIISPALSLVNERNMSTFAQMSQSLGYFGVTTGIRYEHLNTECFLNKNLLDGQSRTYNQFFPSASITYSLDNLNVALSYRRRIERPRYSLLSGNYSYVNSMLLHKGNPFLRPVKCRDINVEASWKYINLSAQFLRQKDLIIQVYEAYPGDDNINLSTYNNAPTLKRFSCVLNASPTFGVYQPLFYIGIYQQWFKILYNTSNRQMNRPIVFAQFDNILSLPKNWTLEASIWWRGKGDWDNWYYPRTESRFDLRITKSIFKKSLDLSLSLNDLFNGSIYHGDLYSNHIKMQNVSDSYNRSVTLTIRYKMNVSKSTYKGEGAGLAEKNRF